MVMKFSFFAVCSVPEIYIEEKLHYTLSILKYKGLGVQNFVSLTSSLRPQLVK